MAGTRRAPKRRGTSPARVLVTIFCALGVVATGVVAAAAINSHKNSSASGESGDVASAAVADASAKGGSSAKPTATGSSTAKPPSKGSAAPVAKATTSAIAASASPTFVKAALSLPHATGPGTVTVLQVPSADNDRTTREVDVYRPAVPDNVVLPVVYLLHGVPGEASTMIDTVKAALDTSFTTGGMAPFEVVAPTGSGDAHSDTEWADAVDGADMIETYLIKNVIPAVEGSSPRPASQRAIVGFSMGGYGAANLTLRHPDLFNQFVSLAGYFHVDDPAGMFASDAAVEAANTPDTMVKQAAGKRALLLEDQDETDQLIQGEASEFATRLENCNCNIDVNWKVVPGAHNYQFVSDSFPTVVKFLDAGF